MQIENEKEQLHIAALSAINLDGTVDFDTLNNNLPNGFEVNDGTYIKGNNKYIINNHGNVDTLLPYGYKECEYIESTPNGYAVGKQYINTGYISTDNTDVKIKYKFPVFMYHNHNYFLFGSDSFSTGFYRFSGIYSAIFKKGLNNTSIRLSSLYGEILEISTLDNKINIASSR